MHFPKNSKLVNIICNVEFVPIGWVSEIRYFKNQFEKQVSTNGGFYNMYGTPGLMVFSQDQERTKSGSLYRQTLSLFYPGLEVGTSPNLFDMDQTRHLVRFTDNHGQKFIMGSLDQAAMLTWNYDISRGNFQINFTLSDSVPIGYDKELGRFFIDSRGILMTTYESSETFFLDADGNLVVDGPDEAAYTIVQGNLIKTP